MLTKKLLKDQLSKGGGVIRRTGDNGEFMESPELSHIHTPQWASPYRFYAQETITLTHCRTISYSTEEEGQREMIIDNMVDAIHHNFYNEIKADLAAARYEIMASGSRTNALTILDKLQTKLMQ